MPVTVLAGQQEQHLACCPVICNSFHEDHDNVTLLVR